MSAEVIDDVLVLSLEQERLAIWNSCPNDHERHNVWAQRKAALLSYLLNDHSTPRSLPHNTQCPVSIIPEAGQYERTHQETVPVSQAVTSHSFHNDTSHHDLPQSYTTAAHPCNPFDPSTVRVYDPAAYVSRLPQIEASSSPQFGHYSTDGGPVVQMDHAAAPFEQKVAVSATQIMTPSMSKSSQYSHRATTSSCDRAPQSKMDTPTTNNATTAHGNGGLGSMPGSPFLSNGSHFEPIFASTAIRAGPDFHDAPPGYNASAPYSSDAVTCHAVDMQRSDSSLVVSSSDEHTITRRRKHIENAKHTIAAKTSPVSVSSSIRSRSLEASPLTSPAEKEAITRTHYSRPAHPKLYCNKCNEYPNGFRGDHELRRHYDRAHAELRKVWICVEPSRPSKEGWWPTKPVNTCRQCKQQKQYNVYYNAAAHLRRAHFCPRKRGRRPKGEERESRAGKAGGDWPPIDWLKANGWLREIEVSSSHYYSEPSQSSVDPTPLDSAFVPTHVDIGNGYPTPVDTGSWHDNFPTLVAPAMEHTMSAPSYVARPPQPPHDASYLYEHSPFGVPNNTPYAHCPTSCT